MTSRPSSDDDSDGKEIAVPVGCRHAGPTLSLSLSLSLSVCVCVYYSTSSLVAFFIPKWKWGLRFNPPRVMSRFLP